MPFRDDEDDIESLSSRKSLERADHGKKERQEERKKKGETKERSQLRRDILRKNVKPAPHSSREQRDDQTKTFGPKTFEEEAVQQFEATAEHTPEADELIEQHEEEEQEKKEAQYEEQQNVG